MRIVGGLTLVVPGITRLFSELLPAQMGLLAFQAGLGILLLLGLWTPIAAALAAVLALAGLVMRSGDPWLHILLLTLGVALALLGPGAWSFDNWLFGWRRIDIRDRRGRG